MYDLFPSIISMSSSAVALHRNVMFAQGVRYSLQIALIVSSSKCVSLHDLLMLTPPFSFLVKEISAGFWFNLLQSAASTDTPSVSAHPGWLSMLARRQAPGTRH